MKFCILHCAWTRYVTAFHLVAVGTCCSHDLVPDLPYPSIKLPHDSAYILIRFLFVPLFLVGYCEAPCTQVLSCLVGKNIRWSVMPCTMNIPPVPLCCPFQIHGVLRRTFLKFSGGSPSPSLPVHIKCPSLAIFPLSGWKVSSLNPVCIFVGFVILNASETFL